jgi:hypothetical protein
MLPRHCPISSVDDAIQGNDERESREELRIIGERRESTFDRPGINEITSASLADGFHR